MLYKLPCGAVEHTQSDDYLVGDLIEMVSTLPRALKQQLLSDVSPPSVEKASGNDPQMAGALPSSPEESPVSEHQRVGLGEMPEGEMLELLGERVVDDPDAGPLSDEEIDLPDPAWQPSSQQLKDPKIAHANSGHPTNKDFSRMIKLGNGKPELVRWVRHNFRCDDCEANRRPRAKKPSVVPKTYRFNHVVGIDLLEFKSLAGEEQTYFNAIC